MGLPMSTRKLRKLIQAELLKHCSQVFYLRAKKASGLHVVFMLSQIDTDEIMQQARLEVRVIDTGDDSDAAEDLSDEIWDAFDHMYYLSADLEFSVYRESRRVMTEEETSVIYRRLLFDIRAL